LLLLLEVRARTTPLQGRVFGALAVP